MLFRPEEVHVRSPESAARSLNADGGDGVSRDRIRLHGQHLLIAHNNNHGLPAVETGRIHPYGLSRKEPANRQRFKASLGEPFLLPVD